MTCPAFYLHFLIQAYLFVMAGNAKSCMCGPSNDEHPAQERQQERTPDQAHPNIGSTNRQVRHVEEQSDLIRPQIRTQIAPERAPKKQAQDSL